MLICVSTYIVLFRPSIQFNFQILSLITSLSVICEQSSPSDGFQTNTNPNTNRCSQTCQCCKLSQCTKHSSCNLDIKDERNHTHIFKITLEEGENSTRRPVFSRVKLCVSPKCIRPSHQLNRAQFQIDCYLCYSAVVQPTSAELTELLRKWRLTGPR